MTKQTIEYLSELALSAAKMASAYIKSQLSFEHKISLKDNVDSLATQLVTAIDLESQRLILNHLAPSIQQYDLGLLTEETEDDGSRLTKDYFWCIDPLDGTLPFTEQKPGYAVSIALVTRAGHPIIGVVVDPYHNEQWLAVKGQGVRRNGKPFTKKNDESSEALVGYFDLSFLKSERYNETVEALQRLYQSLGLKSLDIRTGYGAVMNALGVASSSSACYVKWPKKAVGGGAIWDFAATQLIFDELGMFATTAEGDDIPLNNKHTTYMNAVGVIYATNKKIHQELIKLYSHLK
ncbi:MAG: inositol monophosphatase [Reichenbachiella sp.]|uniref:inositol monophosphatase family protein n=1 Tax=Reichenbachiella sp. TaxID=2184521 RepID=UPI003299F800